MIKYLKCKLSIAENINSVDRYRKAIIDRLNELCDSVDEINSAKMQSIIDKVLYVRPLKMHQGADYQLEKIYSYLNKDKPYNYENEIWGREQALDFSKGFASKWVKINPEHMEADEIRLLISAACYLEKIEQDKFDKNTYTSTP